jgi:hypothetical protein
MGVLGIVVSLAAVYFIISQIDIGQLQDAVSQARWVYLIPTTLFLLLGLVARAFRWRGLLEGGLPIRRTFSIMNVAYLVNGILPLRIGELARVYLATRAQPPIAPLKTASTIVVERLLDLLGVVLMVFLALAFGPVPEAIRTAAAVSAPAAILGFGVLVVMARQRGWTDRLLAQVKQPVLTRWGNQLLDGLRPLAQVRSLVTAVSLTALGWGLSAAAGYCLMFTFYDQASWITTLLYIAAAAFVIAVPAVPGNLGPYELSIILALNATGYGEPSAKAAAFAVLVHGLNLAVHATTGLLGFIQEGVSMQQISQGVSRLRSSEQGP